MTIDPTTTTCGRHPDAPPPFSLAELAALRARLLSEAPVRRCYVVAPAEWRALTADANVRCAPATGSMLFLGMPVFHDRADVPRCTGCGAPREYRRCETCGRED